jgi:mono/diheme cytochrome c family protein
MKKFQHLLIIGSAALAVGCRGTPSENTPIHPIRNMQDQEKFEPFEKNTFFPDESAMRMPVEGTVARGDLHDDNPEFYTGKDKKGADLTKNPLPLSSLTMERGHQRFNIYCSPCHGQIGDGKGIVAQRGLTQGMVPPTSFQSADMMKKPDGHFFDVMTHGIRNMQPYAYQVSVNDRWSIVHYIRALQRSQHASINDVPASMRDKVTP